MPVVYDGARGGAHGDLFLGLKLFISLRVPQRDRWVNLVQDNGGEVVKLEKQADMLIADHVKRNGAAPPPGSYSWQWIEYSVKNGFQQARDDYRIEGVSAQAAGASVPAKGTRVRFTKEDDEILAKFVMDHERQGSATKGNVIFKELWEQYPHHTLQSWRDRWVKYVSRRPRPNLPQQNPQPDARVRGSPGHDHSSADDPPLSQAGPSNRATVDQGDLGMEKEGEEEQEEPAGQPEPQSRATRDVPAPQAQAKNTASSSLAAVSSPEPSTRQRPRPKSDKERLKRQEGKKRRARAAKLLQRTWRGHVARRDRAQLEASIVPLQSLVRGYLLRMRTAERLLDALETNSEPVDAGQDEDAEHYEDAQESLNPEVDGNDSSLRDQFYEDLEDYLEVSGAEIERHPVIDGREVELWDLYSAATQQDCAAEDRDWKRVAQRLGFDWTSSSGRAEDLEKCYGRNLAEFEEAIASYDDQDDRAMREDEQVPDDNKGQGLPQTSDAVTAPKEPSPAPLSPPYRSSSPVAGVKRSFQQSNDAQSELGYPLDGSSKRRRRDRGKAIPQTPEHKLGLAGGHSSQAAAQDLPTPLKSRGVAVGHGGVYSANDADDFLDNGIHDIQEIDELPDLAPPRKKRFIEPETQDFGVVMGCANDVRPSVEQDSTGYMTDEDDNSPSQQLQSEFDAVSSPVRPVSSRSNDPVPAYRPPFVEPRPMPLGGPSKTHTSASGTPAINGATKGAARNSTSNSKFTRRSLPQQYQTQPAGSVLARPSASAPIRNGTAASSLQSRLPIEARNTVVAPANSPGVVMQKSRQTVSATPTRAVQSSVQPQDPSRRTLASSAPVPDPARTQDRGHASHFGKEYVDAQFDHFTALGYEAHHIGPALVAASMQRGPMTVALQSLESGKGIPRDVAGVWTDDDDEKFRKVRDFDRRQKAGAPSTGSGGNPQEKAQVERYRSFLLMKHQLWYAHRLRFMNMMDKGTAG